MNKKPLYILPNKVIIMSIIAIIIFTIVTKYPMVKGQKLASAFGLTPCPVIFKLSLSESMLDCVFKLVQEILTTYLIFLPKLYNLTLIMREHQTNPI